MQQGKHVHCGELRPRGCFAPGNSRPPQLRAHQQHLAIHQKRGVAPCLNRFPLQCRAFPSSSKDIHGLDEDVDSNQGQQSDLYLEYLADILSESITFFICVLTV